MAQDDPVAFRVKVKLKSRREDSERQRSSATGQGAAPRTPPRRSLMAALEAVRASGRGDARPARGGAGPGASASPAPAGAAAAAGPAPPAHRLLGHPVRPAHAGAVRADPFPPLPHLDIEEAEVEILRVGPRKGRGRR